ncbi:DUF3500 domain-containing protein [Rhizobium sp. LCM 4573]|uniref:DUF3500 domain-containing protein n=1 Tax=Rhizobium sp. LCM 4573 TaxID=1848291 RepID=UPI000ABC96DA|nr:DUF3500 domain-containing protein [Rhizobium sp. LCM 4573]
MRMFKAGATRPANKPLRRGFIGNSTFALGAILLGCTEPVDSSLASAQPDTVVTTATPAALANGRTVLERARAFAAALSDKQRSDLLRPYSLANASRWHTYPQWGMGRRGRIGLRLETLSPSQWQHLDALLAAATGSGKGQGYEELQQHLNADDFLRQIGKDQRYGRGDFYVAFLGEPSDTGLWQLQFGGHHFALSNTYREGILIGATPSFRGIEPVFPFEFNGVMHAPQKPAMDAFRALLASLDNGQRESARIHGKFSDVVMGPGRDWSFPANSEGIAAAVLSDQQRDLLLAVIAAYVHDVDDANAALFMARYQSELAQTRVSFAGSPSLSRTGDYVRIDGPSLWIELVMDSPYNFSQPHPHGIWRDKHTDYGGTRS